MDNDQNWSRQLLGLILLSAAKTAAEYITNPDSKDETAKQFKSQLKNIDTDSIAGAVTQAIDTFATTSKGRLNDTIDTLNERGKGAVADTKTNVDGKLGKKKSRKGRFLIGLILGAIVAYFVLDEQRRDDLLDRLTGASGPIQQSTPSFNSAPQSPSSTAQDAAKSTTDATAKPADKAGDTAASTDASK